jgi:hypothetical protein
VVMYAAVLRRAREKCEPDVLYSSEQGVSLERLGRMLQGKSFARSTKPTGHVLENQLTR